ncbi:MAG: iron-sulfur cluster assembly accessory protein, partial [Alphaproteobacteria bacterium]|nr:iron-sulfur cluster assembly accessory protein [Alphaproteobacteria bacterium]
FSYGFRFDSEVNEDDLVIQEGDVTVLIDETSMQFLGGAQIDYVDDLMAAAFKIENPNASSACGCGTSFAI